MSARDTEETTVSPSGASPDAPPVPSALPSWEAAAPAPRPPAAPRPAPRPAPAARAEAPRPYYAAAPPPAPAPPPSPAAYQEGLQEAVQYDLAGNPIAPSGASSQALPRQVGYLPAQAAAVPGVWPPQPMVPYGVPGGGQYNENGTDRVARLKWNWGAFLLPFWWCCFNGQKNLAWAIFAVNAAGRYTPAPFSYILSVAALGINIYLGVMGHRLSWASGRSMGDYEDFIRTQRAWMIWGFAVTALLAIAAAILFMTVAGLSNSFGGGFGHTGGSAPAAP